MALTARRRQFIMEYIVDRNATRAAIRAGYSPKTAYSQGSRLLKNVDVSEAIKAAEEEVGRRNNITVDDIVAELWEIARSPASDARDSELKYASKLRALELIGKYLGMFTAETGGKPGAEETPCVLSLEESLHVLRLAAEHMNTDGKGGNNGGG